MSDLVMIIGERVRWSHGKLTSPHRVCDDIAFATLAANAIRVAGRFLSGVPPALLTDQCVFNRVQPSRIQTGTRCFNLIEGLNSVMAGSSECNQMSMMVPRAAFCKHAGLPEPGLISIYTVCGTQYFSLLA